VLVARACIQAPEPAGLPPVRIAASGTSRDAGSACDRAGTYRAVDFAGCDGFGRFGVGTQALAEFAASMHTNAPATMTPKRA